MLGDIQIYQQSRQGHDYEESADRNANKYVSYKYTHESHFRIL